MQASCFSPKGKGESCSYLSSPPARIAVADKSLLSSGPLRSPMPQCAKRPHSPDACQMEVSQVLSPLPTGIPKLKLGTPARLVRGGMDGACALNQRRSEPNASKCSENDSGSNKPASLITNVNAFGIGLSDLAMGRALGKGKFGNVYLATLKNSMTEETLAVKTINKALVEQEAGSLGQQHIMSEVGLLRLLDHKNIVRLVGFFEDARRYYMVMEHATQGELFKTVKQQPGYRVSEHVCKQYMRQIASAVAYMHTVGIIHRDIKLENILVAADGALKLADFGTAGQVQNEADLRYTRCGTPEYLSPEMVAGTGHNCATDAWALGILTYELLYGCTPFVEYENTGPLPSGTPGASSATRQVEQRVCISAVYRRIAEHSGDLPFPRCTAKENTSSSGANIVCRTPRKMDTQADLIRSVFSPTKFAALSQSSVTSEAPMHTASPQHSDQPETSVTSTASITSPAPSTVRSAAQRILLPASPRTPTSAPSVSTPRRAAHRTYGPTPAQSDAIVSSRAREMINALLQPSMHKRATAAQLRSSAWLSSTD